MNRHDFIVTTATDAALAGLKATAATPTGPPTSPPAKRKVFRIWATSDPHVGIDQRSGRESLAEAIRDSEEGGKQSGPPFEWDIALMLGDFSGSQKTPNDAEGAKIVRRFGTLKNIGARTSTRSSATTTPAGPTRSPPQVHLHFHQNPPQTRPPTHP